MRIIVIDETSGAIRLSTPDQMCEVRGKLWRNQEGRWTPLISRRLAEAQGLDPKYVLQTASPTDSQFDAVLLGLGENPGTGVRVLDSEKYEKAFDEIHKNDPPPVHRCDRCGKQLAPGTERWRKDSRCQTPFCSTCAGLLRIFAGGAGFEGEPMEGEHQEWTPFHKGD